MRCADCNRHTQQPIPVQRPDTQVKCCPLHHPPASSYVALCPPCFAKVRYRAP